MTVLRNIYHLSNVIGMSVTLFIRKAWAEGGRSRMTCADLGRISTLNDTVSSTSASPGPDLIDDTCVHFICMLVALISNRTHCRIVIKSKRQLSPSVCNQQALDSLHEYLNLREWLAMCILVSQRGNCALLWLSLATVAFSVQAYISGSSSWSCKYLLHLC